MNALKKARATTRWSAILYAFGFLAFFLNVYFWMSTGLYLIHPDWFFALVAALFALLGIVFAFMSLRMGLMQLEQAIELAKEHRHTDAALAEAMRELAKELRRRREIPASVTFALFGTPENRD